MSWAGAPRREVVDQERGMMKDFTDEMGKHGIQVHYIAAQAHWQNGAVERQNRWFRDIWEKVVDHQSVTMEEVPWALASVSQAKNSLRRSHGCSPVQWLFGSEGRVGDPYIDGEDDEPAAVAYPTPHDEWHRKQEIRWSARKRPSWRVRLRLQCGEPCKAVRGCSEQASTWVTGSTSTGVPGISGGAGRGHAGAGSWIGPGTEVAGPRGTMSPMRPGALTGGRVGGIGQGFLNAGAQRRPHETGEQLGGEMTSSLMLGSQGPSRQSGMWPQRRKKGHAQQGAVARREAQGAIAPPTTSVSR